MLNAMEEHRSPAHHSIGTLVVVHTIINIDGCYVKSVNTHGSGADGEHQHLLLESVKAAAAKSIHA